MEVPATATPAAGAQAVKTVLTTVAGNRGPKATGSNPTKRAKNILVASRASQRAKILSKRRAATDTETPATPPKRNNKEEGATPEILRGIDGVRALDLSLDPPYPPPPPSLPPLTPVAAQATGDPSDSSESGVEHRTAITEADFYQDVWEGRRRLNTREPSWNHVFPFVGHNFCRFCHKRSMPDPVVENSCEYECEDCFKLTTLQLIVKHAIRSKYPEV